MKRSRLASLALGALALFAAVFVLLRQRGIEAPVAPEVIADSPAAPESGTSLSQLEDTSPPAIEMRESLAQSEFSSAPLSAPATARVSPAASLTGRVVLASTGEAVGNVLVSAQFEVHEARSNKTTEAGEFELPLTSAATLKNISVRAGPRTTGTFEWKQVRISAGEREELELIVSRGGELRGKVVDTEGIPVPHAHVRAWCAQRHRVDSESELEPDREVDADANGAFSIPHVGVEFIAEAEAPGQVCLERLHGRIEPGVVAEELELVVGPERTVRGTVRRRSGEPLPSVTVEFQTPWDFGSSNATEVVDVFKAKPRHRNATTGVAGEFELRGAAAYEYEVEVTAPGLLRWHGQHGPGDGFLEIEIDDGLSLSGTVRGAGGTGLAGASVRVSGAGGGSATTDAFGAFEIHGLAADDSARLFVKAADHAVHVQQPVDVSRDRLPLDVQLVSEALLAGRVVDLDGRGVADVEVKLEGDRIVDYGNRTVYPTPTWEWVNKAWQTRTGGDGHFRFEQLYSGTFKVVASDPDDPALRAVVTAVSGAEDIELVFDPVAARGVVLVGRVVDKHTGGPLPRFTVTPMIRKPGGGGMAGRGQQFEDAEGRFEVVGLDPASIGVRVEAPGYSQWKAPEARYEPGDHVFDVRLVRKRTLAMRFTDREGLGLAGGRVTFEDVDGERIWLEGGLGSTTNALFLDADGRGRAPGLPGAWLAMTLSHGLPRRTQTFEIDLSVEPQGEQTFVADWSEAERAEIVGIELAFTLAEAGSPAESYLHGEALMAQLGGQEDWKPPIDLGTDRIEISVSSETSAISARGSLRRTESGWDVESFLNAERTSKEREHPHLRMQVPLVPCTLHITSPDYAKIEIPITLDELEDEAAWLVLLGNG